MKSSQLKRHKARIARQAGSRRVKSRMTGNRAPAEIKLSAEVIEWIMALASLLNAEGCPKPRPKLGHLKGKGSLSLEQALAPMTAEELKEWEGGD
ncbi:hypothetical protein [Kaistia terrae]|uniref:Uncharacterized protein n=1 Tax=Kaistia terrae TaxID=537017 RepID=A0ABW0Q0E6_9HYPH|nr:hypothetical protein [Kaistia terrae]MCX5578978.1 hypothetical protein [Kaistia terrae]